LEELRRIREEAGLSQSQLARDSGVDRATINKIEQGKRSPSIATLESLSRALGVEMADFFPKAQAPLPLEPEAAGLAAADPSGKLAAAAVLEEVAGLWEEQLARGFYNRQTLGRMRVAGFFIAANHEAAARPFRETLPPHFRAQLEAAEERFADIGARLWEAQQALEEDGRGYRAPPDELAARREAKREELRQQLRGGTQAKVRNRVGA
jgi:transcriptional regulator with XRE-family HTH domain